MINRRPLSPRSLDDAIQDEEASRESYCARIGKVVAILVEEMSDELNARRSTIGNVFRS